MTKHFFLLFVVFFLPWANLRDDCVNRALTETVILCLLQQHKTDAGDWQGVHIQLLALWDPCLCISACFFMHGGRE